ncbi:translation elongation factor 4 [Syntrophobacter fumaroxidans]|uniref:Elongation factor 4 n=1 Tax=Syntrophobacter fumaroxidans (strain DSM 10017 / MPOB) TaxID=335543 RepID=LEPA_SYNFM|nr:translation elongation factor 4 [Syntrophobacter fumaroxidans]A0LI00.1 RecName: Full=Elongation factor 4; Short=EF-4; AltName: Full=Ribosomal back-translocase LepA [Syntrophobacter fumaroxidans MPOB]ABK17052.1 GTP-binding protein LepA [Syntrophobacter fumaroxidans MPOB]
MTKIRNFSIIAHIDHGKSTLADRLIQRAGLVTDRQFRDQILDNMDIERERGITIKSQTVTLPYRSRNGEEVELNLIDTPGHVDFSYEVSRALASCEGVLLLVDASQGVQAQTLANLYAAMEHDLTIIPVINKIDLLSADIENTRAQIESELGLDSSQAVLCSAKEGRGIDDVLEAVVDRIPPPSGKLDAPLSALIFDAHYDSFRGTIVACRVFDGSVRPGDVIRFMSNGATYKVEEVGVFRLSREPKKELRAGMVGYVISGVKTVSDTRVGDTITLDSNPVPAPLPGFKEVKPVVFSSIYPISSDDYLSLADSLEKYKLNDAALIYQKDSSVALGQGFRCGFLGLLHLEIVQERLEREYDQSIIMTFPSVQYVLTLEDGSTTMVDNPQYYPDPIRIRTSAEPFIKASIIIPERYMGAVMKLCLDKRGVNPRFNYPTPGRIEISMEMPLAEVVFDFYDKLKTVTQGYGSFDYDLIEHRVSDLVKLDILVNSEKVDALSLIVHRERAREWAVQVCDRLKEEIPRHQFKIAIQGAIGGKIIARSTVNAFRKDVTAKCYGGDISRKRKLLEKQKKGKKRMKMVGSVMIPQSAFVAVLKADNE